MLVIAHRGNNKESLENTFDAFDKAVECGASRIELDVQLSRDGHAVLNHDDHLIHTTGKNLYCSQMLRSELAKLSMKNGEKIPFLDEVVERYLPSIELNIEIKGPRSELAKATAKVLKGSKYRDKVIISSFCREPLLYMRDVEPDLHRACLCGDDELPWPFFSHLSPLNFMQEVNAKILHPRFSMMNENIMDQAHARGWKVYTWAPMVGEDANPSAVWTFLQSLGVHGHCTNYPREMIQWVKESKSYDQRVQDLLRAH